MKVPLRYQISEYDCGPTAMLDAVSYLFEREEVPPEVIRNIMLYCLDCYSAEGVSGKNGTSCMAMMFLSNWLNNFGKTGQLHIASEYLAAGNVFLGQGSYIDDALKRGGAVVVRLYLDEWHYALLTGVQDGRVRMFDPYYRRDKFTEPEITTVQDQPCAYNRIVPEKFFNREALATYALGPVDTREAIIIYNEVTKLTAAKTVEYFI
ncbi:MAG: hypothetical protein LKF34_05115 [Acidaminococcaceae bacterium]|jgi:hypothetical protein|nr:hypothetical protein [Acidaminococcaceae bacterium]